MQAKKKVLFINTETDPYVAGGSTLARMGRSVPERVQGSGFEIRTFMPRWGVVNERRGQLHEVIRLSGINIIIDGTDHPLVIKVASIPVSRLQVYFIDNDDYFLRKGIKCDADGTMYGDNGERAVFFARGVLETVKKLRWIPDIICCQGWMASLVPLYVKKAFRDEPSFHTARIITSFCNDDFSGTLGSNFINCSAYRNIDEKTLAKYGSDFDFRALTRIAIDYSDGIIGLEPLTDDDVTDYIKASRKPFLSCPGEDFIAAYKEFYNKFIVTR